MAGAQQQEADEGPKLNGAILEAVEAFCHGGEGSGALDVVETIEDLPDESEWL